MDTVPIKCQDKTTVYSLKIYEFLSPSKKKKKKIVNRILHSQNLDLAQITYCRVQSTNEFRYHSNATLHKPTVSDFKQLNH